MSNTAQSPKQVIPIFFTFDENYGIILVGIIKLIYKENQ